MYTINIIHIDVYIGGRIIGNYKNSKVVPSFLLEKLYFLILSLCIGTYI